MTWWLQLLLGILLALLIVSMVVSGIMAVKAWRQIERRRRLVEQEASEIEEACERTRQSIRRGARRSDHRFRLDRENEA